MMKGSVACLLAGFFLCPTFGMYEDQAGSFDWLRSNLGQVRTVAQSPSAKGAAYLATDNNVIASIKLKTGRVSWRQVLPEEDFIDLLSLHGQVLVSVSSQGHLIRAWNSPDGSLLWESGSFKAPDSLVQQRAVKLRPLPTSEEKALVDTFFFDDKIAVVSENRVVSYDLASGAWEWEWSTEGTCSHLVGTGADRVRAVCFTASELSVIELNRDTGEETSTQSVPIIERLSISTAQIVSNTLVFLQNREAVVLPLDQEGALAVQRVGLVELMDGEKKVSITSSGMPDSLLFGTPAGHHLVLVDPKSETPLVKTKSFEAPNQVVSGSQGVMARVVSTRSKFSLSYVKQDDIETEEQIIENQGRGLVTRVFSLSVKSKDAPRTPVSLVSFEDHSFAVVHERKALWAREEALASVVDASFIELPASAFATKSYPAFFSRLTTNVQGIITWVTTAKFIQNGAELAKTLISWTDPELRARVKRTTSTNSMAAEPFEKPSVGNALVSDKFGLSKLLLLSTQPGKLFGVNSVTGELVWWKNLPCFSTCKIWKTHVLRPDRAVTITRDESSSTTTLHFYNPRAATFEEPVMLSSFFTEALVTPHVDKTGTNILALVDNEGRVRIEPQSKEAKDIFVDNMHTIFFHRIRLEEGSVKGFSLIQTEESIEAVEGWGMNFPAEVETISDVSYPDKSELVQSGLRVTRSTGTAAIKYMNPNLIVLATIRRATKRKRIVSAKRSTDPAVNIYIIDAVTGSILEKFVYANGEGPVNVAQSENLIVCHFFNAESQDFEVASIELYENPSGSNIAQASGASGVFSSHTALSPIVVQQSYVLRSSVRALVTTSTFRGITSKMVLAGLGSDQLFGIPRKLLDPRRPFDKVSQKDMEDGLVQYAAELPNNPILTLSYNQTISNIRGIQASDALLESTSLVFVYGLDVFFTRVMPSRTFDMLGEDFNYPFLVATVSIVAALLLTSQSFASRKTLNSAWA